MRILLRKGRLIFVFIIWIVFCTNVYRKIGFMFEDNIDSHANNKVSKNLRNISYSEQRYDEKSFLYEANFDEYCDKYGEWESINNEVFVMRKSVFYLIDTKILYFPTIKSHGRNYSFNIRLNLFEKQNNLKFKLIRNFTLKSNSNKTEKTDMIASGYVSTYHIIKYDLSAYLNRHNYQNFRLLMYLKDEQSNRSTNFHLKVKLKYVNNDKVVKKGVLVCPKCFFMTQSKDLLATRWWVEMLKRGDYTNLYYCDQNIEKNVGFEEILEQNRGFFIEAKLECLPNLQRFPKYKKQKYLSKQSELEMPHSGQFNNFIFNLISQVTINQCYMDNIDKYKYIGVMDNDEIVIPSRLHDTFTTYNRIRNVVKLGKEKELSPAQSMKCNRYDSQNIMESYLDEFRKEATLKQNEAVYFAQGLFFKNSLAEQIFQTFEIFLQHNQNLIQDINKVKRIKLSFNVTDSNRPDPLPFNITIESKQGLIYAINLLRVYNTVVRPLFTKYESIIQKSVKYFDRVLFTVGKLNSFKLGKTFHDTRVSFHVTLHLMDNFIQQNNTNSSNAVIVPDMKYLKTRYTKYAFGHVSHFRKVSYIRYKSVPFESFFIDLNYLFCYFIPIFEDLNKIKLEF